MNTTTATGHRTDVSKTSDTRTLKLLAIGDAQGVVTQTTVTSTETWVGLSKDDADTLCTSSQTSVKDGVTRNYLGGLKIYVGGSAASAWATLEQCWGTTVNTSMQRMNDTNLYSVQRQTQTLTVVATGCSSVTYL